MGGLFRVVAIVVVLGVLALVGAWLAANTGPADPNAAKPATPGKTSNPKRVEPIERLSDVASPRIVVLTPGLAQSLRDIGWSRFIVGRHGWDSWSDPAIPVCGDQEGIDIEKLLSVRPTHVFLQWGTRPLPERFSELARTEGWIVKNFNLLTLDEVLNDAAAASAEIVRWRAEKAVGAGLDAPADPAEGRAPAKLMSSEVDSWKRRIDPARVGRVLVLHTTAPPVALGPGSYHHDMLVRLGATPAITRGEPYMKLDAEDVLRLNPDAIVLIQPRAARADAPIDPNSPAPGASVEERLGVLAKLDIGAVKRNRILVIDDPAALLPGTNLVGVVRVMGQTLATWSLD